jgi:hypothetical protein
LNIATDEATPVLRFGVSSARRGRKDLDPESGVAPRMLRVVVQLGHDRHAHENPWFRQLVRQSVLWAGGRAN